MRFIVSSSELQRKVNQVVNICPVKGPLPVLTGIHFEVKDKNKLQLTASDLELSLQTSAYIEAEEGAEFNVVIPAKILADTLKSLPEQPLIFTLNVSESGKKFEVKIKAGKGTYDIIGYNGQDFPRLPNSNETQTINIPAKVLGRCLQKTVIAASDDELKMAMTGVFLNFTEDCAIFAATNAHHLIEYKRTDIIVDTPISFILPQKSVKYVTSAALAATVNDVMRVELNKTHVFFYYGNSVLTSRLIDASFPDYGPVVPTESAIGVILARKEFSESMKRVMLYANKVSFLSRMEFNASTGVVNIMSEDYDQNNQANENIGIHIQGGDITIGFNSELMLSIINSLETEEIQMEMATPQRAALVRPVNNEVPNEVITCLIMPITLQPN